MKVLVYDADSKSREALRAALTSLGCEVVLAPDGYSVLPLAEQHRPGLVLLDYKPPEAEGFEIFKRLRGARTCAAIPVVFASAGLKFEIEMAVMGAAAVAYVDKPLDAARLKEAVESLVGPVKPTPRAAAEPAPTAPIPPPGAPLPPPVFTGEPDLDGARDNVIELD